VASRRRAQALKPRARAAVLPLPRGGVATAGLRRLAPSRRSLALGCGLLAIAGGGYAALRSSSAFAIGHVVVTGGSPAVRAQVRQAASFLRGTSLLSLDAAELERRVDALPTVVAMRYDRAFPHTLRIAVVPERPVAVLHRGRALWLLSARGRVIQPLRRGAQPALPRVWAPTTTAVEVGAILPPARGTTCAQALAFASHFPARIDTASLVRGQLTLRLRSGLDLRLGEPTDLRLKLAIARRALAQLPAGTVYLDVSLPQRPVAGSANPQVSTGG
jgi:cell division protein FtsQ